MDIHKVPSVMARAGLLAVFTITVANAQPPAAPAPGMSPAERMPQLDQDGDRRVSFDEFELSERGLAPRADGDGDGIVTRDEWKAWQDARAEQRRAFLEQRFEEMDLDSDGSITPEERKQRAFERLDRDGDGYISEEEAAQAMPRGPGRGARMRQAPPA